MRPAADHHRRGGRALGQVLGHDRLPATLPGSAQERREARAVHAGRLRARRQADELEQRGRDVQQRDRLGDPRARAGARAGGHPHDQRDARGLLEEGHLVPEPALAQHLSVIAREQHDGALLQARLAQRAEHLADALVDVADRGEVPMAGAPDLLHREARVVDAAHRAQAAAMGIGPLERDRRDGRRLDRVGVVTVPPRARQLPRVVWVGERRDEQQRLAAAVASVVEQRARGVECDLVVVVGLHRGGDHGRVEHAVHRVVPGQVLGGRRAPVGRPLEARRIDVGRQALLEAVELVGPDEVHLAHQGRRVAGRAQAVDHRGHRRGHLGGVVEHAGARRQQPGQQRRARRRAQGRGAVGRVERDAVGRQGRQVRRLHDGLAVGRQPRGGELVGHHDQDVGRGVHRLRRRRPGRRAARRLRSRRAPPPPPGDGARPRPRGCSTRRAE